MAADNKPKDVKTKIGKSREQIRTEREELKQLIIQYTDAGTGQRYTDKQLDRENLKVELQGGGSFLMSDVERFMIARVRMIEPQFKLEYYEQIFRLRGWDIEKAKEFVKPSEVADYTNELIYGRFKPEILQAMNILNPFIPGYFKRAHWHYQFLNEAGLVSLNQYLDEAITLMKGCATWYECRIEFKKQYSIPYQISMFDENGNVRL